ncbi:MAG TPA: AI-2E family transporter [Myxococcales bacterium]|jgi:predicted PurR-regulated permease PerM
MATILVAIALAALAALVLVTLRSALLWLFISFFLAVVLNPLVEVLSRRLGHGLAVSVVVVGVLATMTGIALVAVPPFVQQVSELVTSVPASIERFAQSPPIKSFEQRFGLGDSINNFLRSLPGHLTGAVQPVVAIVGGAVRLGLAVVSIFFLVIFMLFSGPHALQGGLKLLVPVARTRVETAGRKIYWATTRYALGTGFLALLAGTMATVTLAIAGVPYYLPLGAVMIFLDLIPFAGFVTGGVLITIVTGTTVGWIPALVVLTVFVVYQGLESHVLLPVVHRKTVRVSALGIVVALLIGLELAGILGVLFAVPITGALRILFREVMAAREEHRRAALAVGEPMGAPPTTQPPVIERPNRLPPPH